MPFLTYERLKDQKLREKDKDSYSDIESTKAAQSRFQCRRILDIKQLGDKNDKGGRRIMTAVQKRRGVAGEDKEKPQSAIRRGRSLKSAGVGGAGGGAGRSGGGGRSGGDRSAASKPRTAASKPRTGCSSMSRVFSKAAMKN